MEKQEPISNRWNWGSFRSLVAIKPPTTSLESRKWYQKLLIINALEVILVQSER